MDKRVKRTHKLLAAALLELAAEKDYAAISIKDITEKAEVAYITFFRHYDSKDELLVRLLNETIQEIEQLARSSEGGFAHKLEAKLVFEHIQVNSRLYALLLNNSGTSNARKSVKNNLAKIVLQHLQNHAKDQHVSSIPVDIAANHIVAAFLALIEWWLDNQMCYSPERMAEIYVEMILSPFEGISEHKS
jgi:AcrR family transcriptional regulator